MELALEVLHAWPVGKMALGCKAQRQQKVFRLCDPSIFRIGDPLASWLVEMCTNDAGAEGCVFLDLKFPLDMIEVLLQLVGSGIAARPRPVLACALVHGSDTIALSHTFQTSGKEYS